MTARKIDGWICTVSDELRIASRGAESVSYEPGGVMVITCGITGIIKLPAAVVEHLTAKEVPTRDAFHAHLDNCRQCEQNPFDLCLVGADLLSKAAR